MKPQILVIVGQTATGKSELAVHLAHTLSGEVISADSRQVYRGMDLGTGKITKDEMQGIPHHLLDIKDPNEDFSVEEFQQKAFQAIKDILSRGKNPIFCGGTGYYVQAVVDNLSFQTVPKNEKLRNELEEKSIEELKDILATIPQDKNVKTDTENKRRLIRAIEIGTHFGKLACLQKQDSPYDFILVGLTLPIDQLREKIRTRLQKRFDAGMIEEVEILHKNGVSWKKLEEFGLEYGCIAQYLQKKIESLEEMKTVLATKIGQYAKRQMTWFKRDEKIKWFSPEERQEIENYVYTHLQKKV
jgi:tRNA dimethylallyltransferase